MTKIEVYHYIANNPGVTKRDIATHFHCSTAVLVRPMAELEKGGFLRREVFYDDGYGCAFARLKYFAKRG